MRVRDNGIGIAADLLPRRSSSCSPRSTRRSTRAQGGLGIGLTLVRQFVEMHGGTVAVASEGPRPGQRVRGPPAGRRASPAAKPPRPTTAPAAQAPAGRRVLVVDDNVDAAEHASRCCSRLGADTRSRSRHDGLAAVGKAPELPPDVVLLDIGLARHGRLSGGPRAARPARARRAVLVALTGYGQEQDRLRSREAGFDEHLVKPASIDDLQRVLAMTR